MIIRLHSLSGNLNLCGFTSNFAIRGNYMLGGKCYRYSQLFFLHQGCQQIFVQFCFLTSTPIRIYPPSALAIAVTSLHISRFILLSVSSVSFVVPLLEINP